jgi:hypothetical protein
MSLVWIFHLRAFDLLLWKAVYLKPETTHKPPPSRLSATQSKLSRLLTAWYLLFNFRNVSTAMVIKGLPTFSSGSPGYVPTKKEFLKTRVIYTLITYLVLDAIFTFLPPPNPGKDVPESKQPIFSRIGDVTLEEAIARPITVLLPGFCIYAIFCIPYNIASVAAVLLWRDKPRNWPPLFGDILEAYTLRRFWG